ncbi:putative AAA+ ATPase domain, dynein heavy chain region D6 P-loop domain-containing protein [Plasmopara halstedii]
METDRAWTKSTSPLASELVPNEPQDDLRIEFFRHLVFCTFPNVKSDELDRKFATDVVATRLFEFLHVPDARLLLFTDFGDDHSGSVDVYASPPAKLFDVTPKPKNRKPVTVLYVLKTVKAAVSTTKFDDEIMSGTLERNALESLAQMLRDVYVPLLGNPRNQAMWPEMVTTSIIAKAHGFFSNLQITLGQTKGATCLALPWDGAIMESAAKSIPREDAADLLSSTYTTDYNSINRQGRNYVHSLEGCLITWTKQIKSILNQEPESLLNQRGYAQHGPMEELNFWATKARNLNSIFAQLQSENIRKVLRYLDTSKSTYNIPFAKLCKEVFLARAEANNNKLYLWPLAEWFEKLACAQTLVEVQNLLRPICHLIFLIWKSSQFYNTSARLVVLIRQICSEIIRKATLHLNGEKVFELIEQGEPEKIKLMLYESLQMCAHFKSVYFDYKARSMTEVPKNQWRVQNNALFFRLDAFLERCHDVLELVQTICQFEKLAQMEIGGTKGRTLTASVHQIYKDFEETSARMKNVQYNLMDIDARDFENDFYVFRLKIKELERRLASVIHQAFDDANTIAGRVKCLSYFKDLLDRQIINNELERKHASLITSYASELQVVQQIFIENRDHPPISPNHPPFAGAVSWCRGLMERIKSPMEKLRQTSPSNVLEREESKEIIKLYTNMMVMLQEYEAQNVQKWGSSIETSSKSKLKLPLLRREFASESVNTDTTNADGPSLHRPQTEEFQLGIGRLVVNFDVALVQLLREVKYFLLLQVNVPEDALEIYKRAEVFQRQTGNLELIVDMYNTIHLTLLPVERPLVRSYIDRMDQVLNKGIKALNWKSHGIDVYLKESMAAVNEINTLLSQLKSHRNRVIELLEIWSIPPLLFEWQNTTLSAEQFEQLQTTLCHQKYHEVREGGIEIHNLLKSILKLVRVAQGSPDWRAYVDYVSKMVEDGLTRVIVQSLSQLKEQMDPNRFETDGIPALLEVELHLFGKDIVYVPPIQSTSAKSSLEDLIMRRIEAIVNCSTLLKRLDSSGGTYLNNMQENMQICVIIADIRSFIEQNNKSCAAYRHAHTKYEYLWTTDLTQMFHLFLSTAWLLIPKKDDKAFRGEIIYADNLPSPKSLQSKSKGKDLSYSKLESNIHNTHSAMNVPPPVPAQLLDLKRFQERISFFLCLQNEISESKPIKDVGFVRVNCLPIKQALATWVTKWVYLFTQFLHDRVLDQLVWADNFMRNVRIGLEADFEGVNTERKTTLLMQCMLHIRDVRLLLRENLLMNFEPLKEIVALLKTHGIALDLSYVGKENVATFLEKAPLRWEKLVSVTFKRKEMIQPLQNQEMESIRQEVAEFNRRLHALEEDFEIVAPIQAPSDRQSIATVYSQLDAYSAKLCQIEKEALRLSELKDIFEVGFSEFEVLTTLRVKFVTLKHIWDFVALLDSIYVYKWQPLLWSELDVDVLFEEIDEIEHQRNTLFTSARAVKRWPVYEYLEQKLHQMTVILPVAKHLHSPAMRDRHWKSLMMLTNKHFDLSSLVAMNSFSNSAVGKIVTDSEAVKYGSKGDNSLQFKEILKLELHRFVNEVSELVEVASREFKIEQKLQSIDAAWSGHQLEFVPYRTTESTTLSSHGQDHESSISVEGNSDNSDVTASRIISTETEADEMKGSIMIVKMPHIILECLEEHQLQLQTMAALENSVAHFKDEIFEWQLRLGNVDAILKLWITLQRQWCSLESIFLSSAGDIQQQLPSEYQRFKRIDQAIKELLADLRMYPSVIVACCQREGREAVLRGLLLELEICQKALNQYLDGKKDIFPRFYFVSTATLLDILSNGKFPPRIQPHFGSCFDGIQSFEFISTQSRLKSNCEKNVSGIKMTGIRCVEEQSLATAMISKEGEVVHFPDSLLIHGAVESWFNDLVFVMKDTLRQNVFKAVESSAQWGADCARHAWVFNYPAQVALLGSQIVWTEEVENAMEEFENGADDAIKKQFELLTVRLEELIKLVQGQLGALDRQKIITLITVDVHARDIVQSLITKNVSSSLDFQWQSQLRYYTAPVSTSNDQLVDEVLIKICDFRSLYSYEYTGNCGRLVITPLTDRCYVTLTTALRLCLGGAPAGPAGTGKTETTKDLARGMGLQCYVFNCSDQMNYLTMANIFRGLAQTGAWGCFDEFNRISIEVLSVVAIQVKTVLDANALLVSSTDRGSSVGSNSMCTYGGDGSTQPPLTMPKTGYCEFFGKTIALIPTVGFFITMNPGYAGRAELPENLKALFRSCAMIKPDLQPICENMLMAEGFLKARKLSVKLVTLYDLSSELLSKQKHYDWGLRSVKSVLIVAGSLRRAHSTLSEETVLLQVLRDLNTPRILLSDYPIFMGLLCDLFSHQKAAPMNNDALQAKFARVCEQKMLQLEEGFFRKMMELEEALKVRHSVMLIGPAGCGKSTIWNTLAACHNADDKGNALAKQLTVYENVNPKAITADELYGYTNLDNDWKDGVLSSIMRNMSKNVQPFTDMQTYKWVVLDGDIDAVWIESMNTVMDDNKVLTLVSNERIPLTPSMRLIFEISSLVNATPATVSRAGIIYVDKGHIGWYPAVESWLQRRESSAEKLILPSLFKKYVDKMFLALEETKAESIVPVVLIAQVEMLCRLLDGILSMIAEKIKSHDVLENAFIFCGLWAFGGGLASDKGTDDRAAFSARFKAVANYKFTSTSTNSELNLYSVASGSADSSSATTLMSGNANLFDLYYDITRNELCHWNDKISSLVNVSDVPLNTLLVPTVESTRLHSVMNLLMCKKNPTILVGSSGTGKSSLIQNHMKELKDDTTYAFISMHHYMDARELQTRLEQHLEKKSGRVFGPLGSRRLLYFLDDLNMPYVEEFGTQTALALLRQYMDYKSWYDRHDLSTKMFIDGVQFLASMNQKAGSFTINSRLHRHFSTLCVSMPSKSDLTTIYSTLLHQHLLGFSDKIKKLASSILMATIDLYTEVRANFLATATKFQYIFDMRDLSSLFQGIFMARPEAYQNDTFQFSRLWIHECFRVFSDRMSSHSDIQRFTELAVEQTKKNFEDDQSEIFVTPLICVNFLSVSSTSTEDQYSPSSFNYVPVTSRTLLSACLEQKLAEYNEMHPVMNLVLFDQALEHVTRIVRILASPRGNALLIGVGGSGKQSLSRLAAFILGFKLESLSTTASPSYGINDLKEDLKEIYRKAGLRPAKSIVLLLTDSQITDNQFLVPLADALHGSAQNLFTSEEMDSIIVPLRMEAKAHGIPDTKAQLQEFFHERVRSNLHLVFAFSPIGGDLRIRCRKFPSLISCCTIDWFHPWPREALVDVSLTFLQDIELPSRAIRENVCHHMAELHMSVISACTVYAKRYGRQNYVTPTSFLELIRFYQSLLASKRLSQTSKIHRLEVGIHTLKKTSSDVARLQDELKLKMEQVEERKKATDLLLDQMGKQRGDAEVKQRRADEERAKAARAAEAASRIEAQASVELAIAKPALDAAQEAVNCLNKASLTELKSMGKPPAGVEKVTAAVLMMIKKETKNFSWDNAKKMMAKVDVFKQSLEQYDKENIPPDVVARVEPLIREDPDFNFDKMKSKSVAAANLCVWVVNIITFHQIFLRVKPLMDTLDKARQTKTEADLELAKVQKMVAEVEKHLHTLQASFREATSEKAKVEDEAQVCQERLSLAERLVNGLASEKERWCYEVDVLKAGKNALIGDSLLAASFVSYIGAFNASFRAQLWKNTWVPDIITREIPISIVTPAVAVTGSGLNQAENNVKGELMTDENISPEVSSASASSASSNNVGVDPVDVLSNSSDVAKWMNEGLPSDRISIENGCIITSCQRWPLLVDPELQGMIWLRAHDFRPQQTESAERQDGIQHAKQPLIVIQPAQKNWTNMLKKAISNGQNVIIENLGETIDPSLEPVIMRQIYRKGRSQFLHFAAEEVEVDPRFRLHLHTKLPNPHFRPELLAYCTLIDFSVTEEGLEDQLLANVVNLEQPDLETQKCQLQQEFNGHQIHLLQLENDLLERLSNAPDDILSDILLIEGLEKSKRTALDVVEALRKGKDAEREINMAREVYRPVANEAAMMYFLMGQMCKVNHMYRYSLESYNTFFFVALKGVRSDHTSARDRVEMMKEALRWTIFSMVTRGLVEEHKFLFLTQLVFMLLRRGMIAPSSGYKPQFSSFLLQDLKVVGTQNTISWLNETQWQSLQALITLPPFRSFLSDLKESEPRFREWYNSANPELEKLPLDWRELDKSAPFLKLLIVKCLRPDRFTQAMSTFIMHALPNGNQFLNCDCQLNSFAILKSAFEESSPWTPMYFILSPGSDVVVDVDKLALQEHKRAKSVDYHNIALGQGQEQIAMRTLQISVENGHWVILNNVHLMPTWMLELDKWLEQLAKESRTAAYATLKSNLSSSKDVVDIGTSPPLPFSPPARVLSTDETCETVMLHPNFRLFLTSDPSTNIPIGMLERSIKLTNEPPTGLRANVKRAFCCFSKDSVDELEPRTRCILFALCYFHSLMLERKKFGPQGFNMLYPFAVSDLLASSLVLRNYMDNAPARVPWSNLRYLFGEIMYGGHIVNEFDRLVATTYLQYFLRDELLEEFSMLPFNDVANGGGSSGQEGEHSGDSSAAGDKGDVSKRGAQHRRDFLAPKLSASFDLIVEHINTSLTNETPTAFGLHPNAEVAFRTENSQKLLQSMLLLTSKEDLQGDDSCDEEVGVLELGEYSDVKETIDTIQLAAEGVLQDILESYRDLRFDIQELMFQETSTSSSQDDNFSRHESDGSCLSRNEPQVDNLDPFQTVLLQECQRMNHLLEIMTDSLSELEMAYRGDIPLTEATEKLQMLLYYERVPDKWLTAACLSRRSLAPWLTTLQQRIAQLQEWIGSAPDLPLVLWMPGLFHPQAFLTAVLQTAARKRNIELDSLRITVDVTKRTVDTVDAPASDGQYIHGLYLEGARWDFGNGLLESSLPREMYALMPVLTCRAIVNTENKDQTGGFGIDGKGGAIRVYECPVYRTQERGPTFLFTSPLRTKVPPAKWVLAGVAMLMEFA